MKKEKLKKRWKLLQKAILKNVADKFRGQASQKGLKVKKWNNGGKGSLKEEKKKKLRARPRYAL